MPIGRHFVGPDRPTFIIAEAGVNHNGCPEDALRLVDAAVEAGADAVKFQMFCAGELVSASAVTAAYQLEGCGDTSQKQMLSRLELSFDTFLRIKEHCQERSIVFLATPFGVRQVGHLVELGVKAIKIASTDLVNLELLDAAADTRLPMILSTGASTEREIRTSIDHLSSRGVSERLILLHCVSCYPTELSKLNLGAIRRLNQAFGGVCGLSDHTTSVQTGAWAVAAGACALEKHFTLDREASGPDHAMSLSPPQLAEYIAAIRKVEIAMGDGRFGMTDLEKDVRTAAGRSVVAARDIPAGMPLTREMLTLKRPGTGILPSELEFLVDRVTTTDILSDTVLSWDMVR